MQPYELKESDFKGYPPLARGLADANLALLRQLPLVLDAILLRDVIELDKSFPPERKKIAARFTFLSSLPEKERKQLTKGFANLALPPALTAEDWVKDPRRFEENLSAYLWASRQIDSFSGVSERFVEAIRRAIPAEEPATNRWTVVVLGPGLRKDGYPLFRKLLPHGVFFPHVSGEGGMDAVLRQLKARSSKTPVPYGHWYIDGGTLLPVESHSIHKFSWAESAKLRSAVLRRVESVIGSGSGGPEKLRTLMAGWTAHHENAGAGDPLVDAFVQRVYDEGAGTQIFSTTFVQWSARELLRSAEPVSLVARFGPRQLQRDMNEMFATSSTEMDWQGSLVDGDFGAYYTWINLSRLTGAQSSSFIAWSESHQEALAIGPGLPRGTRAPDPMTMEQILKVVSQA